MCNLLDSYIYGFSLQEATLPFSSPGEMAAVSEQMLVRLGDGCPHLARVQGELVGSELRLRRLSSRPGLDIILPALLEPG